MSNQCSGAYLQQREINCSEKKIRVWNRQDSKASHQGISFTEISQIAPPLQPPPSVRRIQAAQALSVLDHRRASTNIENKQINSRQKPQWAPKSCTPQLKEKDRLRMLKSMQKIKFQLQELKEEYANNISTTDDETESECFSEEIDDEDEFYLFH